MAVELGVSNYLKECRYKNEGDKLPCWVRAARLRGVPSMGFIIEDCQIPEDQLDWFFGVWKYEPPPFTVWENHIVEFADHPQFPKYTKIQRIQYHPDAWTEGLPVRVTEKLHGMNIRLGVVQVDDEWRYMVGSHNCILREYENLNADGVPKMGVTPKRSAFWEHLDDRVMELLNFLCDGEKPVIIFAERVGQGVQDLDYGVKTPDIRVFDIMVDGEYQAWDLIQTWCEQFKLDTVPLLTTGGFSWCMVENFTDGNSIVAAPGQTKSAFKGREGIVVTPLEETYSAQLGGRLIGKSISVDYEARKGGTEYH